MQRSRKKVGSMMSVQRKGAKQLVVLSGKGGTGKTSITAGLVHLSSQSNNGVFVDADVDAANLSLVTGADPIETHPFWGSHTAVIDPALCINCGICFDVCRFDAIQPPGDQNTSYQVKELLCDGCVACVNQCPQDAIKMVLNQDGEWYQSKTPYGHLFHAELFPGAENTGKLVTTVKQNARLFAEDNQLPLIIVDGPPGIGCPVISASAGANLALIVTEPGVSGRHDLERIIKTLKHLDIPMIVCVNKADLHRESTEEILYLAAQYGCLVSEEVPFDDSIPKAMFKAQPVTKFAPNSLATKAIELIWEKVQGILFNQGE